MVLKLYVRMYLRVLHFNQILYIMHNVTFCQVSPGRLAIEKLRRTVEISEKNTAIDRLKWIIRIKIPLNG